MVEFTIWKDASGLLAYAVVVLLSPAFLQSNYFWDGVCSSNSPPNLRQAFITERGKKFETPTVQSKDINRLRGFTLIRHNGHAELL